MAAPHGITQLTERVHEGDREAEPLLAQSYRTMRDQRGPDHTRTQEAHTQLAAFYETRGRPDEAATLQP